MDNKFEVKFIIADEFSELQCVQCKKSIGLQGRLSFMVAYCSLECIQKRQNVSEVAGTDTITTHTLPPMTALEQIQSGVEELTIESNATPITELTDENIAIPIGQLTVENNAIPMGQLTGEKDAIPVAQVDCRIVPPKVDIEKINATPIAQLTDENIAIPIGQLTVENNAIPMGQLTGEKDAIPVAQVDCRIVPPKVDIEKIEKNPTQKPMTHLLPMAKADCLVDATIPYHSQTQLIPVAKVSTTPLKPNPLFEIPTSLRKANLISPIVKHTPPVVTTEPTGIHHRLSKLKQVYMIDALEISQAVKKGVKLDVCYIYNGSKFLVSSLLDQDDKYRLQTAINLQYGAGLLEQLEDTPIVGEVLLGNYSGEYYRALITGVDLEKQEADIEFVDFGDYLKTPFKELYIPTPEMMKHPLYGLGVKLFGIRSAASVPDKLISLTDLDTVNVVFVGPIKYNAAVKVFAHNGEDINELIKSYGGGF